MANCVACLSCGHKFAPQYDVRKKKNSPCPKCGSTDQLELVGVSAPEPEALPPEPAPPPARPEPPGEVPFPAADTFQTTVGDYSGQDDSVRHEAGDVPDGSETEDLSSWDRHARESRRPPMAWVAILLLIAFVGGYLGWSYLWSGDEVASTVPQGEGVKTPAAAPADTSAGPAQPEAAEPQLPAPIEPGLPAPKPEPAGADFPKMPDPEPAIEMPARPGDQGVTSPEPTSGVTSDAAPPLDLGPMPSPGGEEPSESVMPGPALDDPDEKEPAAQPPAEPKTPASEPVEEPAGGSMPKAEPAEPALPAAKVAQSLDEAQEAIVKFELPLGIGDLMQYGAGFLIDPRGWVATNNHVAANITTDSRVRMRGGGELKVEGVLASLPHRDLALVKLADPPENLTILDIQYDGSPALGEQVYAFGHPYQADFSLSNGIVGRVLTTAEMLAAARELVVKKINAPADMVWIQHDAKISPGNSGGPLIDDGGRVLGVNTFVNLKAEFGYASHVRYLRELAASATGEVTPAPPPREFVRTRISGDQIKSLFASADGFAWKPRTPEQYDHLAELAKQLTLAKHALAVGGSRPGSQQAVLQGVARLADQAFAAIEKAPWGPEQLGAFNDFAVDQVDHAGEGVVMYGAVWATNAQKPDIVVMALPGAQKPALVRLASPVPDLKPGSRWLIFGFVTPNMVAVNVKGESEPRQAHLLLVHYMTPVP